MYHSIEVEFFMNNDVVDSCRVIQGTLERTSQLVNPGEHFDSVEFRPANVYDHNMYSTKVR